uniref:Hsp90 co-chaperone Cdc37-like 1 n=1 Tax=Naja naja TaxID=35670 RepID=A0A8C6Y3J8_NAJNA
TRTEWPEAGSIEAHPYILLSLTYSYHLTVSYTYNDGIELACQQQKEFVKSSVECKWNLAEAQQKLGNLALHNSESLDQEHAKAQTEINELRWREEEWRRKEEVLRQKERQNLWNTDFVRKLFVASHCFPGMLSRWFDSQRFLSDHPFLVCEETAKYLLLWCFHLEAEQKGALMEQVAHQAVVMQFIIEMAKSCNVDPRGCFRLFFQRAKTGDEGYLEAFKNELEAFKSRVRICSQSQNCQAMPIQNPLFHNDLNCIGNSYLIHKVKEALFEMRPIFLYIFLIMKN